MFTHQHLKNLATTASFSKGRAYFEEGLVGRVRRRGDTFSAMVNGSADYSVELTLTDEGPNIFCDCPYDYEGICKHAVALGLAVLEEQEWTTASPARPTPAKVGKARNPTPPSAAALEAALRDVSKSVKLKFLEERLRQDGDLVRLFLLHVNGADSEVDALAFAADLPPLAELRDTLRQQLTRMRFDYDTLADKPGQTVSTNALYYNPEPVLDRVTTLLNAVLLPAATALRDALQAGRLAEGIRRWQGAWAGIQAAIKPAADVFWLFSHGRYAPLVLERWLMLLTDMGVLTLLGSMTVAPAEAARCIPALTQHVLHPLPVRQSRRLATPALQLPNVPGVDDMLLLSVSGNPSLAPALTTALRPREKQMTPLLRLRLAAGRQDWDAWERLATAVAPTDSTVALDLLRFYQQRHNRPALLRAATQLIKPFFEQLTPFVLAHVTSAEDRDLYVTSLMFRCEVEQRFADFEELCGLWKPAERLSFVQKCVQTHRARFTPWFRAQVLAAERRASEILPLALTSNWHPAKATLADPDVVADLAELPDVLALAAHAQPEATLDAVMERVEQYLDNKSRRSPELYQRIGAWLRALHAVPALSKQVVLFAEGLYTTHNRLQGLRTALHEVELLPEAEVEPHRLPPPRRGKRKSSS